MGEVLYTDGLTALLGGAVMWWSTARYYRRRLRRELARVERLLGSGERGK
jgi:hypothetical protein